MASIEEVVENVKDLNINMNDYLLKHMEINVSETENRSKSGLNTVESYTVYLIETRLLDNEWKLIEHGIGHIWRRYTEFEQLRNYLRYIYPWAIIPPLPEKKQTFTVPNLSDDNFDAQFIDRRRAALENFLHRIAQHPIISKDTELIKFLQEVVWKCKNKDNGYLKLAENQLKAINAVFRIKKIDPDFEELNKRYGNLNAVLTNVLKTRAKCSSRIWHIHRLNSRYGKIFSSWSAIEKDMADGLQRAGHFFDSFSDWTDTLVEDEEQIVDQLKEYLYYTHSVQDVCCKRDTMQMDYEKLNDVILAKKEAKERISNRNINIFTMILDALFNVDAVERLKDIDDEIDIKEKEIQEKQEALICFKEKALTDVATFEKKKILDLKQTLHNYINFQIKLARKGVQTWTNIKESITSIPS